VDSATAMLLMGAAALTRPGVPFRLGDYRITSDRSIGTPPRAAPGAAASPGRNSGKSCSCFIVILSKLQLDVNAGVGACAVVARGAWSIDGRPGHASRETELRSQARSATSGG
jgi:hypothetical protein